MADEGYHEPYEALPDDVRDIHRAIVTLMEELEAVDWYYQRAAATKDEALRQILLHHAGEETEHAMMMLEWIRRRDGKFDEMMREYLFKEGSIVAAEATATGKAAAVAAGAEVAATSKPADDGGGAAVAPLDAGEFPFRRAPRTTIGSLRAEARGSR